MARRKRISVSLKPHLQRLIARRIASGRYTTAEEVIQEGLRLLTERDQRLALGELRTKIDLDWQQSEHGEGRDGEAVFAAMRARLLEKL